MKDQEYPSLSEFVFGVVTFVVSGLTSLTLLAQYIHPSDFVFLQWIGLSLPIWLAVNVVLLLFWAFRKKKWLLCPLVALLINSFYFPKIFQLSFMSKYAHNSPSEVVVGSYNVRGFRMDYGGSSLANVADLMNGKQVDVLCLQEVPADIGRSELMAAFHTLPYMVASKTAEGASNLAILSRFPIRSSQVISFPERPNCAMSVDLDMNGKLIRLFNCHLQTTSWNQVKKQANLFENDFGEDFWHLLKIESVMSRNYELRASQADGIRRLIDASSLPVVVCGDFNDVPASYVYHKMKGDLQDSFEPCGKGYAYTYRYLHKLLRIDYLFCSPKAFTARHYQSPDVEFSDHNPIIIGLEPTRR